MDLIQNRYSLSAELGRGGMGVVYSGRDTLLQRDVAIKVLSDSGLGSEGRSRLLHEAQAAAQLNHPNIVTVYDAGEEDKSPFIVMELVEGSSLHDQMPESIVDAVEVTKQICQALEKAHSHGIVHRDLKPENVLISHEGTAKLMDFGLARSVASRMTSEGVIMGTVFYMAPELALGRDFDGRADLYALGVMLYEMTTGQLPFIADDPVAVISQHLHAPLVPPQALNGEIPAYLEALIVKLLAKDPGERYRSAGEVLADLEMMDSAEIPGAFREASLLDRIVRGRMVARDKELGQARTLWSKASSGQGQTLLISGEPGIGKSRLIKEILTEVEVTGGIALVGECWAEGSIPYSPFAQLLGQTFQNGVSKQLALPDFVMADLLSLAPSLRPYYPHVAPNPPLDLKAERYRLFENLVAFCNSLAQISPAALVFEDVHWADSGSLALLRHLARRTRHSRLMIVATYREVELDEALPFNEVLQDLNRERLATRVKLSRLDLRGTEQLLGTLFAEDVTPEFLDGIYHETEGNPFFIEEVCKALVDSGDLTFQDGRWHRPSMEEMRIPQSLRVAIQSRVNKLSQECQSILLSAAILGREFRFDTLLKMSQSDEDIVISSLEEAIAAQLVDELRSAGGERFIFAHALIPSVLRDGVSGLRRSRLHRRAAAAIEAIQPDDYEALAYQYSEAGDEPQALHYFILAGERAKMLYANEDAIRFLSEALAFVPQDSAERLDLLASRASVFGLLARRDEQLADVEEMLALADTQGEWQKKAEVLLAIADYHLEGDHLQVHDPANEVLSTAREHGDIALEAQALRRLGRADRERYELASSRDELESASKLFLEAGLIGEAANCSFMLARVLDLLGESASAKQVAIRAIAQAREAEDRRAEASSMRILAILHYQGFETEEAWDLVVRALAIHQELGDRVEECHDLNVMALIASHDGRAVEAEELFRQGLEIGEALGLSTIIQFISNNMVLDVYRPAGQYEAAIHFLNNVIENAVYLDHAFLLGALYWNQALIYKILGAYDSALESMAQSRDKAEEAGAGTIVFGAELFIAQTQAEAGNIEKARELFAQVLAKRKEIEAEGQIFPAWLISIGYTHYLLGDDAILAAELSEYESAAEQLNAGTSLDDYADALTLLTLLFHDLYVIDGDDENLQKSLQYGKEAVSIFQRDIVASRTELYCFNYYKTLMTVGREVDAQIYLRKAYDRVMQVASNTKDEALRSSWLDGVKINREILKDARKAGIGSP